MTLGKMRVLVGFIAFVCFYGSQHLWAATQQNGLKGKVTGSAGYTDNVFRVRDAQQDRFTRLSPEVTYYFEQEAYRVGTGYSGNYALYTEDSDLNYRSHKLFVDTQIRVAARSKVKVDISFQDDVEQPGLQNSGLVPVGGSFNQFEKTKISTQYLLGKRASRGQIIAGYQFIGQEYQNNQQDFRDNDRHDWNGKFFVRIAPKLRTLIETGLVKTDYQADDLAIDQSNKELSFLLGLEWEATAKTFGALKLGYKDKEYDEDGIDSVSGFSYSLEIDWQPNDFVKVGIDSNRNSEDASIPGETGEISTEYGIELTYKYSDLGRARIAVERQDEEIEQIGGNRTDIVEIFELGATHRLRPTMELAFSYQYSQRESERNVLEYTANQYELALSLSF